MKTFPKIALVGNPNSGKSSLFNQLTGLHQKTGNFPGVTVDKRTGICRITAQVWTEVIDLPGTYSLYPKSPDEQVVADVLLNPKDAAYPDLLIVVVDASNLKRNLLLYTEVKDLGIPVVLALNMMDVAEKAGIRIDIEKLSILIGSPIVSINARNGVGIDTLKSHLERLLHIKNQAATVSTLSFVDANEYAPELTTHIKERFHLENDYLAFHYAHQGEDVRFLDKAEKQYIGELQQKYGFKNTVLQAKETLDRYEVIREIVAQAVTQKTTGNKSDFSTRLDKVLLHRVWGFVVFFGVLFLIFQAIFAWATYPMDLIDRGIATLNDFLQSYLPESMLVDLLTNGLIAGLGGVLMFIPQIAILFAFIAILEESGYMARVVFIMDRVMRVFGLNGKSVVPLISGVACAVPAIMATRNIDNWKERLITILVTPLMSCSARIPIYTILIALVVPDKVLLGIFNLQGLALMGMYLLGFTAAIVSAFVMKLILKAKERSFLIMELPNYKVPRWTNVGLTIVEKVKAFVLEAGKVILAISIVLWVLASYGPSDKMAQAEKIARQELSGLSETDLENKINALKLENSYAGHLGRLIEPVIKPLGYDWKIGIALITSFAAREVFVGTLSTIYSVGDNGEDTTTIKQRLRKEVNPDTGQPMYSAALAFSLLVFYAFAMQCMSTIAVVYRETKGWKWPLIQLLYMTSLAYLSAFGIYTLLK